MGYSSPTPINMDNVHGNQSTSLFGFIKHVNNKCLMMENNVLNLFLVHKENLNLQVVAWKSYIEEKPHFLTCLKRLKVSFATIKNSHKRHF